MQSSTALLPSRASITSGLAIDTVNSLLNPTRYGTTLSTSPVLPSTTNFNVEPPPLASTSSPPTPTAAAADVINVSATNSNVESFFMVLFQAILPAAVVALLMYVCLKRRHRSKLFRSFSCWKKRKGKHASESHNDGSAKAAAHCSEEEGREENPVSVHDPESSTNITPQQEEQATGVVAVIETKDEKVRVK